MLMMMNVGRIQGARESERRMMRTLRESPEAKEKLLVDLVRGTKVAILSCKVLVTL